MFIGYDRYIVKSKYGRAIMCIIPKDITSRNLLEIWQRVFL